MSQQATVRRKLVEGWTCGSWFLEERIPRYAARIHELSRDGVRVERRPCASHQHRDENGRRRRMFEWRAVPADRLF